ncbi:helix-turn-helix domain-containing GNAT family N-acetyltransferase [Nocardia sp. XZ_19_385]|uniref:bifunctional helix-turn-helix transcriptional regulator/GNAT family N-acetyltransferase n=1 Tax=Nocardia sp. XZ_19_385 TaxID=2769488 RepID=UPI00188FB135|nr:helix-turn-helix domain-containing GNAT family N-acetyltransferase [Nocardia sp. XZ_19_385]
MTAVVTGASAAEIAAVRAFNRRYTEVIGVLREGLVDTEYSLTEARILFELATSGSTEAIRLRKTLGLDPGYLSRILTRFKNRGLIESSRSSSDGRRQEVRLTDRGRAEFAVLNQRSGVDVRRLLEPHHPAERAKLIRAMTTIQQILERPEAAADSPPVTIRAPKPGDYGWVIQRNAALYAAEYGWDASYEALVTKIVADFLESHDDSRERAWIAEAGGTPVGAVFCVADSKTTARLRLLLVEPSARGLGVGSALVGHCLRFATDAGYTDMVLWTNDVLAAARHIYQRAGFELVESAPHHSFGHDLIGQTWRRALRPE